VRFWFLAVDPQDADPMSGDHDDNRRGPTLCVCRT
jgi:hypothetical protein